MTPLEAAARVLELDGRATPGPMRSNGPNNVCLARDGSGHGSTVANTFYGRDVSEEEARGLTDWIAATRTLAPLLARAVQEQAREIEALRRSAEDAELMLRAALRGDLRRSGGGSGKGDYRHAWPFVYVTPDTEALAAHGGYGTGMSRLRDDGTGLPLLTDEARGEVQS